MNSYLPSNPTLSDSPPDHPAPSPAIRECENTTALKNELLALESHLKILNLFSEEEAIDFAAYHLRKVQEAIALAIHNNGWVHLIPLQKLMSLISYALPRQESYHCARKQRVTRPRSKFEPNRTDGSQDIDVQSAAYPPFASVVHKHPADSCAKTMTCHDCDDFHENEHSDVTSTATAPTFPASLARSPEGYITSPDNRPVYSPCYPSSPECPNSTTNSMTNDSNQKMSKSSPNPETILAFNNPQQRLFNASDDSDDDSDPHCAGIDTVSAPTVAETEATQPGPPQWACRAHNDTDPSQSLTSLDIVHPVAIKLEDFPRSPSPESDFVGPHCYSCSNNEPINNHLNFYPDAAPEPLPDPANEPDPAPMDVANDDFGDDGDANQNFGEPNEVPSGATQQPIRVLPPLFPTPPLRHHNPLNENHQNPFEMFQDPSHTPASDLFFTDATLNDHVNGTIRNRDLPHCVMISNTIAAFCLTYLATPLDDLHIRDITLRHMKYTLVQITLHHQNLAANQLRPGPLFHHRTETDIWHAKSMFHTLNRATNLVINHLDDDQRSEYIYGHPTSFEDASYGFFDNNDLPMSPACALGIIYALRLYYLTHCRNYARPGTRQSKYYPTHLFEITKDIRSTAAALSLFPSTTTFRTLPDFVSFAFADLDIIQLAPDGFLNNRSINYYKEKLTYLTTEYDRANPFTTEYVNSFLAHGANAADYQTILQVTQQILRLALFEHALIHRMTLSRSKQPELRNNRIHIGNLPPADLFLSNFATCFPMVTKLSDVQMNLETTNVDTLAINFVVCQPICYSKIFSLRNIDDDDLRYMDVYTSLKPIPTNTVNDSIDFLPHFEYILYRVVQLLEPKDPDGILPKNFPPLNVAIFQGSPIPAPTYLFGSPTELAKPTSRAGIFPLTTNQDGQPIISNRNGQAYNRFTVRTLFRVQAARPILAHHVDDPDWIPRIAADLRRYDVPAHTYYVARDPSRVPFSLAIRMIPVYTTGPTEQSIYKAWALPHLNDALRDPELQLFNNFLSYYHTERENHPEFPFIDQMGDALPVRAYANSGESNLPSLSYPGCYAGYLPFSICDSLGCPKLIELAESNNIITFQQDQTTFSGPHFACLAVSTRRSSLKTTPTRTPDPLLENLAENDPQDAIPARIHTQNDENDTETLTQQQISDTETTYDEYAQETQELPGTQQNLAFSPPNSPETGSSHTETTTNSPPTAKSASGPLQRISEAVSNILTPKHAKSQHETTTTDSIPPPPISPTFSTATKILPTKNSPTRNSNPEPPNPTLNLSRPQNQDNENFQRSTTKTTQTTQKISHSENNDQNTPKTPKLDSARQRSRPATHATFSYPPTVETFFDDDTDHDSEHDPKHIQPTSPDALTSSTRTDFTYPPIEDLTKTLLKYAKNANLRKLAYPTDLQARRRHFNTFIDNLRIVCNISPWTRQVFDLWPQQVSYSHPFIGSALYNLIFTNVSDPCQKHIIDGLPDARTAILTLRRHCAPLTPDHVERTREAFCAIKQPHHEVATSYLNRIRILTRDCYHAGIPNSDAELIKRAVRGGSNHSFYAASYQRFDADIRRAELNDEALPPFAELESHLLNIDESRGLTLPSQSQRNYNQHANSARQSSHHFPPRQPQNTQRYFTQRQQQAFSSILRPYTNNNGATPNRNHHSRPPQNQSRPFRPQQQNNPQRPQSQNPNHRRPPPSPSARPQHQPQRINRPSFRPTTNPNQRPSSNGSNNNNTRTPNNLATVVCNNCGRLGHYSRNCTNARSSPPNRSSNPRPPNNENNAPRNQQRAYFITDSGQNPQGQYHHQAFKASSSDHLDDAPSINIPWPNPNLPQMTINQPLLDRDYLPTANHAPPNSGATEYFPDDPQSPYQRFGPPILSNWLPDSGATSHYTPLFSDLRDVEPCNVPVSLADGSTKLSTHKGTTECHFTTDDGLQSILGLTDVYYVEGLSHRLLSLTALSCTQNFSVLIKNRATTIQLPNGSTYTWPILNRDLPSPHQAFSTTSNPDQPSDPNSNQDEEHFDDTSHSLDPDQRRSITSLPLELISRRLAHRNFRNLMVGSLHQTWNDHVLSPTIDPNTWPLRISISQKRARNKTPQRQGTEPFHRIHLDLMRNPFRYGLTTNTNFSAYLFIVTTPGKLTGWIGLPTESTASIIIALKQWLTDTELLGRTHSVRFIRTDAGTAFTSTKFINECTSLGIKVEAAAPEHQEMNGICEAKWREVHNTANILLNNARLGGAFFHHAHAYAVHIINVCPAKNVIDQDGNPTTPYQYSYQRKPSLANFRVFGCPTFFKRYEPTFRNKLITYKQQLQRATRGIFLGFPDNSAGWLIYSPDQPQSLIITRDAYFDEDFNSALCFDSKPFAGAIPIRSHFNPNGLRTIEENSEPSTYHQTGSAANLGNPPSTFIDNPSLSTNTAALPDTLDDDDDLQELISIPPTAPGMEHAITQHGPTAPTPHQINYVSHQERHSTLHKMMTIYFQECNEDLPSIDPIHSAMMTIDSSPTQHQDTSTEPVDKYLPEPQSLKAVLKLDDDVRNAWLHAIRMEIKNLIDHKTFILGETPHKNELIIPVKLVLKAKQTATGKLDKLKARLVARGDLEKRLLKKMKHTQQQETLRQRQEIAATSASGTPNVQPPIIPVIYEDTWSPCASSRGVKLLISTTCASRRTLKSADFIGAYLQAKVIGRHFVKLPLEYAYHFPEYAKFFGIPLLLDKGIYGLVYSGKYWNIEFSEWLYSQGFIQSPSEPSYFVRYDKHNQWLRLLFFVDDMLYVGSNDSIEKQFEDSVNNRFDVKFLGPAQWFLQMRIHQHQDSSYTLDQHRYVLNTLQRYDPNSEFPERDTPFPPDYTFSKDNRPVTASDIALVNQKQQRLPFRSAVCTLLYLAYNTRADILFAVCKLAKACISPGIIDFRALSWLIGYLRRRPYYALKFYPDCTSNPVYDICLHHRIPYADLTVFSDASWQDCPDTGRSTVGYMIFHNGALIEANSTMPTPVAMSTSEAEYMAACSATMATAHIRMLLYDMLYLGTKQWRESTQRLPSIPAILMIDNEATVQIAKNGKLTRKTRHIERRFHFVRQGQQDGSHQLHWIPCDSQLADILTKTQHSGKIDPHLTKIFCVLPDHMLSSTEPKI